MNPKHLIFRPLTRSELNTAINWAAKEGWNPGLHDAEVFWNTDPEGYVGAELEGELVGTGSVVSYSSAYGFMGFFIVRPDLRGSGIGTKLWFHRRDLLLSRLAPGASIGMDGVFDMQDWYAKGGFQFTHRNLRMEGRGRAAPRPPGVVEISAIPFDQVEALDRACFGFRRTTFLRQWIDLPESQALAHLQDGSLSGFGVIRRCREGCKIGPLFADSSEVAEDLYVALANFAGDGPLWLDVPEINTEAMALAGDHHMTEVFGCARMYYGPVPNLPWERIFGVTTFELG